MKWEEWIKHPLYVKAKKMWEAARIGQIKKGAEKYPEPLNPKSWTAKQLINHGIMENVDQLHYLVALDEKVEEMQNQILTLERALSEAQKDAEEARKQLHDQTYSNDKNKRIRGGYLG